MRFIWGSCLGLLLCGTVVFAGILSEDLKEQPASEDDILSLLKDEQLILSEAEKKEEVQDDGKGTCIDKGHLICSKKGEKCTDIGMDGEEARYLCEDCLDGHEKKDGKEHCELDCDCGEGVCSKDVQGKQFCQCKEGKVYRNKKCIDCDCGAAVCEVDENGQKQDCKCNSESQKLYNDKCVDTCTKEDNGCKKANRKCADIDSGYECKECLPDYIDTNGKCVDSCKTKGTVECAKDKRKCKDSKTGYQCDVCEDNYIDDSGKCKKCDCGEGICSMDKLGRQFCKCEDGKKVYHDKKCIDCDCGVAVCEVDDSGKKKDCTCNPKSEKLYNDKCVDCDCGVAVCEVDENGQKQDCKCNPESEKLYNDKCVDTCTKEDNVCKKENRKCADIDSGYECKECLPDYIDTNGKCVDSCKTKGTVECAKDKRKCKDSKTGYQCDVCEDNYIDDSGKCKKCDCGEGICSMDKLGRQFCKCEDGKKVYHDKKCIDCDCGVAVCEVDDSGKKKDCTCNPKSEKLYNDKCVDCDCGVAVCEVDENGQKQDCKCNPESEKLYNDKCVDTCTKEDNVCKKENRKCADIDSGYECKECLPDYIDTNGKCVDSCKTKGTVECAKDKRKCKDSKTGYQCDVCEDNYIDDSGKCKKCDCGEGICSMDKLGRQFCKCEDGKKVYHDKKCIDCDCGVAVCEVDDSGKKKDCTCNPKSEKLYNDKCVDCDCGVAVCEVDENGQKQDCKCNPESEKLYNDKCVDTCTKEDNVCKKENRKCADIDSGYECKECLPDYIDTNGKCVDSCKTKGTVECAKDKRKCKDTKTGYQCDVCEDNYIDDSGKCKKCDCGEGICSMDNQGKQFCKCEDGKKVYHDKKCIDCDCGVAACEVDDSGKKKDCTCKPKSEKLYKDKCVDTCTKGTNECKKENKNCADIDSGYECKGCLPDYITANEKCEDSCKTKGKTECAKDNKKCKDTETGYKCDACENNYIDVSGICRKKCASDTDCNNGKCGKSQLCECDDGYGGDFCDTIPTCDAIKDTCSKAKADCKYDTTSKSGVCVCKDVNYVFKNDNCDTHKSCEPDPCNGAAKCSDKDGIGHCKCDDEKSYFDYSDKACKKINLCLLNKVSCKRNEECKPADGKCTCVEGFYREDENKECKPNTCDVDNPCFADAKCEETGDLNGVKCYCEKPKFYDGSGCKGGGCFLNDKNCSSCPDGTTYNEKNFQCEIEDQSKKCNKKCGFGWCLKEGEVESCVCFKGGFVEEHEGKCVLSKLACASYEVEDDRMKCNCTGIYTLSDDGITCRRKTCEDEDVLKKCKDQNAKCVTSWTDPDVSHSCKCDEGYELYNELPGPNKCITPCERPDALEDCFGARTCYLTNSGKKHECKCLPSFEPNNQICEPNTKGIDYLLKNLPVKKDKYLKDGKIDQVRLSNDVIDAMNAAYLTDELKTALVFNSKIVGNSIGCDVWLQFNEGKTENAKRLTALEGKDFLPPSLELSQNQWKVELEKMTFCSEEVSKVNCGGNTICKDTNCTCKSSGFREIISTEKIQGNFKSVFCEDINECEEGNNRCTLNTTCENIVGDYNCNCKAGFKKVEKNKFECTDLCDPNPCKSGSCQKKDNAVDCKCDPGYGGSLCDAVDENFKRANQNTVIVGAVLGTLLAVVIIILAFYIRRQRKNSYSEDFTPAPRMENAEMAERGRPMRGVSNRGYQN